MPTLRPPRLPTLAKIAKGGYSGPERRKTPRIGIEELNALGAEALRRHPALREGREDRRSAITKVLDLLDVPRNVVANIVGKLAGVDTSKTERATLGLPRVFVSDILAKAGVEPGPLRSIAGFIGDVAIDPTTYLFAGATTGRKIAQYLPRILKRGAAAMKAAAQTGRISGDLRKAIGIARAGRLEKAYQSVAKAKGAQAAARRMFGRGRGAIEKRLIHAVQRGDKGAISWWLKHGEKGRSLLRVPFAEAGFPILKHGAKARRYKALAEATTEAGRQKFAELAARRGAKRAAGRAAMAAEAAKTAAVGEVDKLQAAFKGAVEKRDAARKVLAEFIRAGGGKGTMTRSPVRTHELRAAQRAVRLSEKMVATIHGQIDQAKAIGTLKGKFEVSPAAEAVLKRTTAQTPTATLQSAQRLRKAERGVEAAAVKAAPRMTVFAPARAAKVTPVRLGTMEAKGLRTALTGAKEGKKSAVVAAKAAAQEARAASEELVRFLTHPTEAPAVLAEKFRTAAGPFVPRGAPGVANRLRQGVQRFFGAPRSELHQRAVGLATRYGPVSASIQTKTQNALARQVQPIIARYAAQGHKADDIRSMLVALREAGLDKARLAGMDLTDPIRAVVSRAERIGLAADPDVAKFLGGLDDILGPLAPKGVEPAGYYPRLLTGKAQVYEQAQRARGATRPGAIPGTRFSIPQPSDVARAKWLYFDLPDGTTRRILSSNLDEVKVVQTQLRAAGLSAKPVRTANISTASWNAPQGAPRGVIGPETPGVKPFTGDVFTTDIAEAVGRRVASENRRLVATDTATVLGGYGVDVPKGISDKSAAYAHMARPHKPPAGNPFLSADPRMFDRMYPVQIADMLDTLTKVWEAPEAMQTIARGSDRMLGVWKAFQLYHPAYVIRNVWQNTFGGIMAGANALAVAQLWAGGQSGPKVHLLRKALIQNTPEILRGQSIALSGRDVPLEQLWRLGRDLNMAGAGRTAQEMAGAIQPILAAKRRITGTIFKLNQWCEDNQKLATWLHFADRGMDVRDAAIRTLVAMPDLSDLSIWERSVAARFWPFWRWMRRNGSLQLFHFLPRKPAYAAGLGKLRNLAEGFRGVENVPTELRPGWMDEQLAMQITGGPEQGDVFLAQTWFPFQEALSLAAPLVGEPEELAQQAVSGMRPGVKAAVEAATGQSVFRRTPLKKINETDLLRVFPQALMGRSGTMLDSLLTLRPAREWTPWVGRVAEMPTATSAVGRTVLGGAFQPVSRIRGLAAESVRLRERLVTLRQQINRARQVNDMALADSLLQQWVATVARARRLGLPIVPKATGRMMQTAGVPAGAAAFGG